MNSASTYAVMFAALLAPLAGCHDHPEAQTSPTVSARVEGNRVILPSDSAGVASAPATTVSRQNNAGPHLNGRLVWDEDATVRVYSPVGGRVRSVLANTGETIVANAPLALIDSPDFGQAQADARKAEADLTLAERTLERSRALVAHGAAAQKDLEAAEDTVAGAQAEQQRAFSRLTLLGATPGGAVDQAFLLRTPVAGVVVERNLNVGQELRPDLMLANAPQLLAPQFVVSNPRRLWVVLDVTEMDIRLLAPGQALRVSTRALPGRVFAGRLATIGNSLDATTRTVKARGSVENAELLLKAEMYVDVEVDLDPADGRAVAVASPALITRDNHTYVFVETTPRVFERREVRVGSEADGQVFILDGVRPGEHVVIEGSLLVEEMLESGGRS